MLTLRKLEELILFQTKETSIESDYDNAVFHEVRKGNYCNVLNSELCQQLFTPTGLQFGKDRLNKILLETAGVRLCKFCTTLPKQYEVLFIGVSSFLAFVQSNWTGPVIKEANVLPWLRKFETVERSLKEESRLCLNNDAGAIFSTVRFPELMVVAGVALKLCTTKLPWITSAHWWMMRFLYYHQQILDEFSVDIHESLTGLMELVALLKPLYSEDDHHVQFHLELASIHLYYLEYTKAKEQLDEAQVKAEVKVELRGALGKRTRYQEHHLSQLLVSVSTYKQGPLHFNAELWADHMPQNLSLADEVRLSEIEFLDPSVVEYHSSTPSMQAIVLCCFFQKLRVTPFDTLTVEELLPYISCILMQPRVWSFHVTALLFRCRLEARSTRTVERSLYQIQTLLESIASPSPSPVFRLSKIFISYLPPYWKIEADLVELQLKLGFVQSALDIATRHENWPQVIYCYSLLQQRFKAAEIIKQELDKKETVKLWCMLGDATDDLDCYEKAWGLSGYRSALARKHLGMYYYNRKLYAECIPYFRESLDCNSLQATVWFRLAYAALVVEDWELCASAYRHYCSLDSEDFQAWNNLSKAYIKMGQIERAFATLNEAVKCNYEVWQVWDNLMAVSTDCREFGDVIRCYHRLLDLKGKHCDKEVLGILVNAIVNNVKDYWNMPACKYRKTTLQLFGRLTGIVTNDFEVWKLYAQLTASIEYQNRLTTQKTARFLRNAYKAAVQNVMWEKEFPLCTEVILLCISFADACLKCCKVSIDANSIELLVSSKLILKCVVAKVKKEHIEGGSVEVVQMLEEPFMKLKQKLIELVKEIEVQRSAKPDLFIDQLEGHTKY